MRKYIIGLFVFIGCTIISKSSLAQAVFAGGEIHVEYVGDGSEDCTQQLPYKITMRFFRDAPLFTVDPLPATTNVFVVDITSPIPSTWPAGLQTITLDSLLEIDPLPNIAAVTQEVVTDGGYYSNRNPILLDPNRRYKVIFGEEVGGGVSYIGREFHSPSNANINQGQRFFLKTEFHTFCDSATTGPNDTPPNEQVITHLGKNQAPLWNTKTEVLETLCEGNSYRFDLNDYVLDRPINRLRILDTLTGLPVVDTLLRDSVSFRLKPVFTAENRAAIYVPPRSTYDPFPCSPSDPFRFSENSGVMTFTPQLGLGERIYTAPITVEVTEWRRSFTLEDDGSSSGNFNRRVVWDTLSISTRQIRFLIANRNLCDDNLPVVESEDFNAASQAWEFDCASDTLDFRFTKPMLYETFAKNFPFDFRIMRVDPNGSQVVSVDQSSIAIDSILVNPDSINRLGEFSSFRVLLYESIGPGRYAMHTRVGDDGNTLGNYFGFFMPEYQATPFLVNEEYEYIFRDDDDAITIGSQKNYCFPGDAPIFNLDALRRQRRGIINRADSFDFKFTGSFPRGPATIDTFMLNNSRLNAYEFASIPDPYDYPNTPVGSEIEGFWTVGVGLNFPWTGQNGSQNDERCFDDDITFATVFEHPKVSTVDIDLCRQDRWPVIKDLVDPKYTDPTLPGYDSTGNPLSYRWVKYSDSVRTVLAFNNVGEVIGFPGDTVSYDPISVGGSSNSNSQASGNVNDTLDLQLGVGFGVGFSSLQKIRVYVTFPNGCIDSNTIQIVKQDVNVKLAPEVDEEFGIKDTTICLDDAFPIFNTTSEEYLRPDSMSRQWYFGEDIPNIALPNDTTDTLSAATMRANKRGWYKLVVTKTTDNSTCEGSDSIFVDVADSLVPPKPECSKVTFDKNTREVQQRFYWPTSEGAERFEVRGVDQEGRPLDSLGTSLLPDGNVEWYRPNDLYGIHHTIYGKEVQLLVRSVNNEVPVGASCKYGSPALAQACEVLVKPTNVFTPNGDGINDVLRFDLLELYDGNTLQVFNRWGKLVYEDGDYQNDWNGGDLKEGTYFYILDIGDPSGRQDIFKGTVTILR